MASSEGLRRLQFAPDRDRAESGIADGHCRGPRLVVDQPDGITDVLFAYTAVVGGVFLVVDIPRGLERHRHLHDVQPAAVTAG